MTDRVRIASGGVGSSAGRFLWQAALGAIIVIVCFRWGLPAFAPYAEIGDVLIQARGELGAATALALFTVALFNLVAPSTSQTAALPGLSLRQAVWADWSTTTITNMIPGGSALAIGLVWSMYRSFGLARAAITRSIIVTGVWDVLVKLGAPLPALLWLSTQRPVSSTLVQAALIGAALFAVAMGLGAVLLTGDRTAIRLGGWMDRLPFLGNGWAQRLSELRSETVQLLAERGWWLTAWTVIGHLNLCVLLVLCLRAVGVESEVLGWAGILAAFAFGRLVTALPLTPGGLGVMELGLTSALAAVAQTSNDGATAALVAGVLLFRFFSFAIPTLLGGFGLWRWWSFRQRGRAAPDYEARADIT